MTDPLVLRRVMSSLPTGVTVVTTEEDGLHSGVTIGSFTSVSLEPPLVGFFTTEDSSTLIVLDRSRKFCVNVLRHDQVDICLRFASPDSDDRFSGVDFAASPSGCAVIEGSLAWLDCSVESVTTTGDHLLVLGRVEALSEKNPGLPLIFWSSGFGTFAAD